MNIKMLVLCLLFLLLWSVGSVSGEDASYNSVHFSFILSGHLLFGLGYEYGFNENNAIQFTAFPLLIPGKKFPFAFTTGYAHYFNTEPWRAKLGLDFGMIVSPPVSDKRKILPLLIFSPGVEYRHGQNAYASQFWLARFLKKTNPNMKAARWPLVPIGWEFKYGRKM